MKKPVKYLGWIYGNKNDEALLRSLGIKGPMTWNPRDNSNSTYPFAWSKNGIFTMCEILVDEAPKILSDLTREYPLFNTVPFTGVDEDGKPVCGLNWRNGQPAYNNEWHPL